MAINVYEVGESVHLTATFSTSDGSSPQNIICKVKQPNASIVTPSVSASDGLYGATITASLAGKYFYRWECDGAAEEGQFRVIKSRVL